METEGDFNPNIANFDVNRVKKNMHLSKRFASIFRDTRLFIKMKDSVVLGFLTSVALEFPEYEEIVTDLLMIYQSATTPAPTIAVLKSDKKII